MSNETAGETAIDAIARIFDETPPFDPDARPASFSGSSKPTPLGDDGFSVAAMNLEWALVLMGGRAVIVREQAGGPIEDRMRFLTIDAFRAWFGNRMTRVPGSDGEPKLVTWAAAWLASRDRRQFAGLEFTPDPNDAPGAPGYLNLWRGFAVTPRAKANGYAVFRDHLLTNVCGGDHALFAWVFGWFAHLVQRPRERIGTALVLRGKMGTGKTKVGEVIGRWALRHRAVQRAFGELPVAASRGGRLGRRQRGGRPPQEPRHVADAYDRKQRCRPNTDQEPCAPCDDLERGLDRAGRQR